MATVKMINKVYTGGTAYYNVIRYISENGKFLGGVIPQLAASTLSEVEAEYNDDPAANVLYHLIFTFYKSDKMKGEDIDLLCKYVSDFYEKHQTEFAVEKTDYDGSQLHVVINAFSFVDGEKLFIDNAGLQKLVSFCKPALPYCTVK